jgi:hypothetical protein
VSIICGSSLSHNFIGKVLSSPWIISLKWVLKVWIALFARFLLWVVGGTNCSLQFFYISCLNFSKALSSNLCILGLTVFEAVICSHRMRYALIIESSVLVFIGLATMKFLFISNSTNIYLFLLIDVVGNVPVWLVYIVSLALKVLM